MRSLFLVVALATLPGCGRGAGRGEGEAKPAEVTAVSLEWIAASESPRYAQVINTMCDEIRRLGPFAKPEGSAAATMSVAT